MVNPQLLVIFPPITSHLVSAVEATKLLLARDHRLTVKFLLIKLPKTMDSDNVLPNNLASIAKNEPRVQFVELSNDDHNIPPQSATFLFEYINSQVDTIRKLVSGMIEQPSFPEARLAGLLLDMTTTRFIQVAREFNVPSYVYFVGGPCSLGQYWDVYSLKYEKNHDLKQFKDSDMELSIQTFSQPFPAKAVHPVIVDGNPIGNYLLSSIKTISESDGILLNTFYEFESYAIESLASKYNSPKAYPIGPILEAATGDERIEESSGNQLKNEVMNWLDKQPEKSVVFLCFGTQGTLHKRQLKEFAKALEDSGSRFLWSLRKPARESKERTRYPVEYQSFEEVLPEGFLKRTEEVGKVIGWAPQAAVLSHKAVGAFVSHCGWNSTLESVWYGVPMAALPMYAEQHVNAFQLVRELGIAEEISFDYFMDFLGEKKEEEMVVVPEEEIEGAIRRVMAEEGVRKKVKEMQRKSREALEEGGSSYNAQIQFLEDFVRNARLDSSNE